MASTEPLFWCTVGTSSLLLWIYCRNFLASAQKTMSKIQNMFFLWLRSKLQQKRRDWLLQAQKNCRIPSVWVDVWSRKKIKHKLSSIQLKGITKYLERKRRGAMSLQQGGREMLSEKKVMLIKFLKNMAAYQEISIKWLFSPITQQLVWENQLTCSKSTDF